MKKPFWKYATSLRPSEIGLSWVSAHLMERCFETKETLTRYYNAGSIKKEKSIEVLLEELQKLGGHIVKRHHANRHANPDWFIIWEDGGYEIEYWSKNRGITVTGYSVNEKVGAIVRGLFDNAITRTVTKGRVYVVVQGGNGGAVLKEMGVAGEEFIPSNYRPETVTQYRHVVDDLNKKDPCGRIILLNGEPGTGKTHMVRALLNEVLNATFILVPSNFIAHLGDPSFLNVLLGQQKNNAPLVLILEDSDEALIHRKEGNVSAISALLNFSDGIFGTLLDMRLVCTTNVEIKNLDPAVTRDGRLCTRMDINLLDTDMANAVYERLTGKKGELKDKFYKLGTVYKIAKGNNVENIEKAPPKKKLGFLPEKSDALLDAMQTPEARAAVEKAFAATPEELGKAAVKAAAPEGSPARDLGLSVGETYTDDGGMKFTVDEKGQLHAVKVEEIEQEEADPDMEHVGEVIHAVGPDGELHEVGHIDQDGHLTITDAAFINDNVPTTIDDDDDLIDEDPDDDIDKMPEFFDADLDSDGPDDDGEDD